MNGADAAPWSTPARANRRLLMEAMWTRFLPHNGGDPPGLHRRRGCLGEVSPQARFRPWFVPDPESRPVRARHTGRRLPDRVSGHPRCSGALPRRLSGPLWRCLCVVHRGGRPDGRWCSRYPNRDAGDAHSTTAASTPTRATIVGEPMPHRHRPPFYRPPTDFDPWSPGTAPPPVGFRSIRTRRLSQRPTDVARASDPPLPGEPR